MYPLKQSTMKEKYLAIVKNCGYSCHLRIWFCRWLGPPFSCSSGEKECLLFTCAKWILYANLYQTCISALSPAFLTCVTSTIASWPPSIPNYPWTKLRNWGESNHFVQLSRKKEGLFSIKDGSPFGCVFTIQRTLFRYGWRHWFWGITEKG